MKPKKITLLFDVSPLSNSKKSGVGYYTERLLVALATKYPDDLHIVGHYFNFLDRKTVILPQLPNIEYRHTRLFPSKILNILRRFRIELPLELFLRKKGDFILFPNFVGYPVLRRTPATAVIHDLGYIDYPAFVQAPNRRHLERFVPRSIKRSRFIIAISQATKQTLKEYYGMAGKKILVTPIPPPVTTAQPSKHKSVSGKFILFIGTLEPRKNFIGLVHAYMLLPDAVRKQYSLVLAGGAGWYVEKELQEIERLKEKGEKIVITGYFSDAEKAWLLGNASLFVQPSHYEGFGMPILEAMDAGTPTAVSDIAIFHEVSGDASLYFDHNNPHSISKTILTALNDKKLCESLVVKGNKQLLTMSWDKVAQDIFERIVTELE